MLMGYARVSTNDQETAPQIPFCNAETYRNGHNTPGTFALSLWLNPVFRPLLYLYDNVPTVTQ